MDLFYTSEIGRSAGPCLTARRFVVLFTPRLESPEARDKTGGGIASWVWNRFIVGLESEYRGFRVTLPKIS
ncbi:hypothetical protein [Meridianimarinicoccus aquatilis]|uniref:Uncharacterized protein n=1 Tax=Meridianimarinicoccus aquatilis TaxID=2552766 RepID=A0A4R6ACA7_9RHOB|nr:hypothetical protein [Fluviibacterium aquatile]TDL81450.1 hypothetical protein E2L05_20100 [Fluviibacterium aquatile]